MPLMEGLDIHFYSVEKNKELLPKNFSGIDKLMKVLKHKGKDARQSLFLTFDGYGSSSAEVFEIEEIRQFVKILFHKHPQVLYFLSKEVESLQTILMCYCDIETFFVGEKKPTDEYTIEDVLYDRLPKQPVKIFCPKATREKWVKEIMKLGKKFDDVEGAKKVIEDIESLVN